MTQDTKFDRLERVRGTRDLTICIYEHQRGTVYKLPCLGGEANCRRARHIDVIIEGGRLLHLIGGDEVRLIKSGPIRGWGNLDCDWSYDVGYAGAESVPPHVIDHMVHHHGVRIVTEEN